EGYQWDKSLKRLKGSKTLRGTKSRSTWRPRAVHILTGSSCTVFPENQRRSRTKCFTPLGPSSLRRLRIDCMLQSVSILHRPRETANANVYQLPWRRLLLRRESLNYRGGSWL